MEDRIANATFKLLAPYIAALSVMLQDERLLCAVENGDAHDHHRVLKVAKKCAFNNKSPA